jgi:hypothetical protein
MQEHGVSRIVSVRFRKADETDLEAITDGSTRPLVPDLSAAPAQRAEEPSDIVMAK